MECPCCSNALDSKKYGLDSWNDAPLSATLDCYKCAALLLFEDRLLKDFHKEMHKEDPRWPEDGSGTGFVAF